MSTLRTKRIELSDGSKGVATDYVVDGSAKVWVSFNYVAGTPIADNSLNVSSLTDISTGRLYLNFTSVMMNAAYASSGMSQANTFVCYENVTTPKSTNTVGLAFYNYAGGIGDHSPNCLHLHGDLA